MTMLNRLSLLAAACGIILAAAACGSEPTVPAATSPVQSPFYSGGQVLPPDTTPQMSSMCSGGATGSGNRSDTTTICPT